MQCTHVLLLVLSEEDNSDRPPCRSLRSTSDERFNFEQLIGRERYFGLRIFRTGAREAPFRLGLSGKQDLPDDLREDCGGDYVRDHGEFRTSCSRKVHEKSASPGPGQPVPFRPLPFSGSAASCPSKLP